MQTASFRVLSTIVWLLLFVALALVVILAIRDNPPESELSPTFSPRQLSASEQQAQPANESMVVRPTFTSTPRVIQPASVPLLDTRRILAGGYSFRPIEGYQVEVSGGSVTMAAPDADEDIGPTMLLLGGAESSLIRADTQTAEDAFDQFINSFAQNGDFAIGDKVPVATEELTGLAADLSNPLDSSDTSKPFTGRIFLTQPNPPQYFALVAIAPTDAWEGGVAQEFDAVLDSISLFQLTNQFASALQNSEASQENEPQLDEGSQVEVESTETAQQTRSNTIDQSEPNALRSTRTATPTPTKSTSTAATNARLIETTNVSTNSARGRIFTNGNYVNEAIVVNELVWAATDGGVVVWNQSNGSATKYTTADGLLSNQSSAVAFCEFADLGIVFGTSEGLQIFNLDNGRWSTLTSENSLMSFDDVSDLYCDSVHGFMVIGYQRHGLDIFDANENEWLHFDRNRALVSNIVRELAVVGDRKEIWVVSDLGLTILENIPEPNNRRSSFYNYDNSPLKDLPIDTITKARDSAVWMAQENTLYRISTTTESVAGSTQREWETFVLDSIAGDAPRGLIESLAASGQADAESIWVGTEGRDICLFDPASSTCTKYFNDAIHSAGNDSASALTYLFTNWPQSDSRLYFATYGNGVNQYDGTRWTSLMLQDEPIASNNVRHLALGNDGTIWIATSAQVQLMEIDSSLPPKLTTASEAQRIRQGNRSLFDSVQRGELVTALWGDANRRIWLGTDGADLYDGARWKSYTSLNGLVGSPVQSFAVDNQGRDWIGTRNGLNVLNEETFFNLTTAQGLPDDNIQAIAADQNGAENVVWIGTASGGLLRFEKNQLQVLNVENANLPSNNVSALAIDGDGSLLVGTDNGLARVIDGNSTTIRPVGDVNVTTIATGPSLFDSTKMIWVGTQESGLFHFNGFAWEPLASKDLPDRHITALLVDDEGSVWIGGAAGGLVRYNPTE